MKEFTEKTPANELTEKSHCKRAHKKVLSETAQRESEKVFLNEPTENA